MFQAYLRGWLKRDYPMGFNSRLRERAIMEAIGLEEHSQIALQSLQVSSMLTGSHLSNNGLKGAISESMHHISRWVQAKYLNHSALKTLSRQAESMTKAFSILEESGILEQVGFDDELRRMQAAKKEAL